MRRLLACMDFSMWSSTLPKDSRSQPVSFFFNHTCAHSLAQHPLTHSCRAYMRVPAKHMIQSTTAVYTYSFHCAMVQQRDGQMDWCRMRAMRTSERGRESLSEAERKLKRRKKNFQNHAQLNKSELPANIMPAADLMQMFLCITVCADAAVCVCFYHRSSVMLAGPCQWWTAGAAVRFVPCCTITSSNIKYLEDVMWFPLLPWQPSECERWPARNSRVMDWKAPVLESLVDPL